MAESTTLLAATEGWDLRARRSSWTLETSVATTSWGTISVATAITTVAAKRSLTTESSRTDTLSCGAVALVESLEALSRGQFLLVSVSMVAIDSVISVELMNSSSYRLVAQDLLTIVSSGQTRLLFLGTDGGMHLLLTSMELTLAMDRSWCIGLLLVPCAGNSSEGGDDSEFLEHVAGGWLFLKYEKSNHLQLINSCNRNC